MRKQTHCRWKRRGFSYLEMQVSMGLFVIALTGLGPLTVMHSRQLTSVQNRLDPDNTYYLTPSRDEWARKLGTATSISVQALPPGAAAVPPPPPRQTTIIDDGDADYAHRDLGLYDWWTIWYGTAFQHDFRLNFPDNDGDVAAWSFRGLPAGNYTVYATWIPFAFSASQAEFDVFDDATLVESKQVDQSIAPNDETDDAGVRWEQLGQITFSGNTLQVQLSDRGANGFIVCDAVKVVRHAYNQVQVLQVTKPHGTNFVEADITFVNAAP